MNPLLEQFLSEARDNLSFIDKNLEKLRFGDSEDINALFRAAHTLKGGSGLVGLVSVKDITHYAEDLLDALRKNKIEFDEKMIGALYDAFDEIIEIIDATEESGDVITLDESRVDDICAPMKLFLSKDEDSQDNGNNSAFNTDLNIVVDNKYPIGDLIASFNIPTIAKNIPFEISQIDQDFIDNQNIYLLDIDLDENCVEFGNDPVYLITLLGEENIYSINTYISKEPKDIFLDPTKWYTRFCIVVKSDKDTLEDALYNIIDDIRVYPLSIKELFITRLDSEKTDVFEDFAQEFKVLINQSKFEDLSEKISAITKIISPDSKEHFILSRAMNVLPSFVFSSNEYIECVKYVAEILEIDEVSVEEEKPKVAVLSKLNQKDSLAKKELSDEEKTAIAILNQQLKILKHNNSIDSINRVIEYSSNVVSFIELEFDFSNINDSEILEAKILECINEIESITNDSINEVVVTPVLQEEEITNSEDNFIDEEISLKIEDLDEKIINEEIVSEIINEDDINPIIKKDLSSRVSKESNGSTNAIPKTVKIDQVDIDAMMDIVGEILVMKNSLPYIAQNITSSTVEQTRRELLNKYEVISRITEQLQDRVMGMRLLPLSYIFSRYPKLIRDISKKLNKKIRFVEEGGTTRLDKTMIEQLADPLVHVIRNSLDHGIEETEDDRIKLGKNPEGFIKISAESRGDKVHIIVEDDGRGINIEKVISKALENNLATVEEIDAMSESERLMLIFHPGLSTKDEITDLSGRGVGSDAVKRVVEGLAGTVELESQKNVGTKLTMVLPVSVALTKVFHVKMNNLNYAIAMDQILETIKIKTVDIVRSNHKPFVTLRGDLIPLVFESNLLSKNQEEEVLQNIVIVQGRNSLFGLVVNEFVNQLDVVQKPLEGVLANHPMISGTSLLGNGEILFVLDTTKLID
jgi:two-component system chemotaxis sensor kinase CheA